MLIDRALLHSLSLQLTDADYAAVDSADTPLATMDNVRHGRRPDAVGRLEHDHPAGGHLHPAAERLRRGQGPPGCRDHSRQLAQGPPPRNLDLEIR